MCDAATKEDGVSLNYMLLKESELLNFIRVPREPLGSYVDIKEMIQQIPIKKEDRHAMRMLWRDSPVEYSAIHGVG